MHHFDDFFSTRKDRMTDDSNRKSPDSSDQPRTLKFKTQPGLPPDVEATIEEVLPDIEVFPIEEDEETALLNRRELLQLTREDISYHRLNHSTRPFSPDATAQVNATEIRDHVTQSTAHLDPDRTVEQALPTIDDVTRSSIGTIDHERGTLEFPARLLSDDTFPLPQPLAKELGIEPGDLILVTIQKLT